MTENREPFSILMSYWYYKSQHVVERITAALENAHASGQPVRVLVDSGAFSADSQGAPVTVTDYAGWLDDVVRPRWGRWTVGALNLDVLRDPEASYRNWRALRSNGHHTVPVTHLGDPFSVVDRYVENGADFIALGAMVGRSFTRKFRWAAHVHAHVNRNYPHVKLHGLGVGSQKMVERLPWWSVDTTSFSSAYRYGRLIFYDPKTQTIRSVPLDGGTEIYAYGPTLRRFLGINPAEITTSHPGNRRTLVGVAAESVILWQTDLRSRRPIQPPRSLDKQTEGTHVHFVEGSSERLAVAIALHGTHVHYVDGGADLARAVDQVRGGTL